jgi:hypothetical protein
MKRLAISTIFSTALVATTFACVANTEEAAITASAPALHPNKVVSSADAPPKNEDVHDVVFEVPQIPYARVLPFGAFKDVNALCTEQKKLIAPYMAELKKAAEEEPMEVGLDFTPSCKEAPEVLKKVTVALDGSFESVKAITVETGHSTDIFLVVKNADGYTAIREAFLSAAYNDPGCGSIERENAITSITAKNGSLVVVTESDRSWWTQKPGDDDSGELLLTNARACSFGDWGPICGATEMVNAKIARRPIDDPDTESVIEEVFKTGYELGEENSIVPAKQFDESKL